VTVVFVACAVMLTAAVVLVLRRVEIGPSILDRVVALDVVVSTFLAAVGLYVAWAGRTDLVPVLIALSLVGFIGAVSVARLAAAESEDERRILNAEEARRGRRRRLRAGRRRAGAAARQTGSGDGS
jgi:multicomponent Na+:H+ antiporter subunit F